MNAKIFAERLQVALAEKGVTISELAALLGCSTQAVYNAMRGDGEVRCVTVRAYAAVLHLDPDAYFFDFDKQTMLADKANQ